MRATQPGDLAGFMGMRAQHRAQPAGAQAGGSESLSAKYTNPLLTLGERVGQAHGCGLSGETSPVPYGIMCRLRALRHRRDNLRPRVVVCTSLARASIGWLLRNRCMDPTPCRKGKSLPGAAGIGLICAASIGDSSGIASQVGDWRGGSFAWGSPLGETLGRHPGGVSGVSRRFRHEVRSTKRHPRKQWWSRTKRSLYSSAKGAGRVGLGGMA